MGRTGHLLTTCVAAKQLVSAHFHRACEGAGVMPSCNALDAVSLKESSRDLVLCMGSGLRNVRQREQGLAFNVL